MVERAGYRIENMTFSEFVEYLKANLGKTVVFRPLLYLSGMHVNSLSPHFTFTICEINKVDDRNVRVYGYDSRDVSHILNFWHVPREMYDFSKVQALSDTIETVMLLSREAVCCTCSFSNVPGYKSPTCKACR